MNEQGSERERPGLRSMTQAEVEADLRQVIVNQDTELRAARDRIEELEGALRELDAWVSRMPDAGFSSSDPRWGWWHSRPDVRRLTDTDTLSRDEQEEGK